MKSPRSLMNRFGVGSSRLAVLAIGLGLLAQFWLASSSALFGGIVYLIASVLFIRSVHSLVPSKFDQPVPPPLAPEPKPQPAAKPALLIGLAKSRSTPKSTSTSQSPSFWKHWRYYTIANLIKGTPPNIPANVLAPPQSEATPEEIQNLSIANNTLVEAKIESPVEVPSQPLVRTQGIEPVKEESTPLVAQPSSSPPVTIPIGSPIESVQQTSEPNVRPIAPSVTPAGPHHARIMAVAPSGQVVVIDSAKKLLFVFGPQGQLHKQQQFETLPNLTADDITFSPDGTTAYIFDSVTQSLKVIPLL